MAEVRYRVPGIPPQVAAGVSAFMPHFNRQAGGSAQDYKYAVSGFPGTKGIPAPTTDTQVSPDDGDKAQMGFARSSDAPPVWYPNQYYQRFIAERPGAGMPILLIDPEHPGQRALLPIPALDPPTLARANQAMSPPTGIVQRIKQLPVFPRLYSAPDG